MTLPPWHHRGRRGRRVADDGDPPRHDRLPGPEDPHDPQVPRALTTKAPGGTPAAELPDHTDPQGPVTLTHKAEDASAAGLPRHTDPQAPATLTARAPAALPHRPRAAAAPPSPDGEAADRERSAPPQPPGTEPDAEPDAEALRAEVAERVADLQRVKAEYDNYRKRTHRDRLAVRQVAVANVLRGLLPVLDAVEQARQHGDVTGEFAIVADALETQLAALGLEAFGEPGDPFDPVLHDALSHRGPTGTDRAVCAEVLRPGYRVGDHLLRPATVTVVAPPR
jgi:molecular chaperone GrpE